MEKRERVVPPILVMFSRTINALRCYLKKKKWKDWILLYFSKILEPVFLWNTLGPGHTQIPVLSTCSKLSLISRLWLTVETCFSNVGGNRSTRGKPTYVWGGGNTQSSCRKVRAQPGIHHLGVEMWRCYPLIHHALLEILRISTIN